MNNLHRELAPISDTAWADLDTEARRTFTQHVAARRVVDVIGPGGETLAAVGTGHSRDLPPPAEGVLARNREVVPLVEFRVPFVVSRQAVDDVERGAKDADWQPVKDAAKRIAFAEDRAVFDGFPTAAIPGIRAASSNSPLALPTDVREFPTVITHALRSLRLAGVAGPYRLLLSADTYTAVAETTDHGYPIREHTPESSRTARLSGCRRSRARSCCPPEAVTTSCTSARTCRSATSRTTPTRLNCTSRSRSRSLCRPARPASR
jgi:uncharacterized linocin/CFP29 family protein